MFNNIPHSLCCTSLSLSSLCTCKFNRTHPLGYDWWLLNHLGKLQLGIEWRLWLAGSGTSMVWSQLHQQVGLGIRGILGRRFVSQIRKRWVERSRIRLSGVCHQPEGRSRGHFLRWGHLVAERKRLHLQLSLLPRWTHPVMQRNFRVKSVLSIFTGLCWF